MESDPEILTRAFLSRDRRFEGRFVAAVVTTGVYCRPGCPAPLPKRRNVRFYPCPAAAEAEGFRPCRRCRPDGSPGAPALLGTGATVSRALRLIGQGEADGSVEGLASRLGVGGRHLRRLFDEHLGAPPLAVVRTHRTHFARRLLDQTCLPVTQVATGAGFSSLRSFNRAMRETFGRSPRELRRETRAGREGSAPDLLTLSLPFRPPFDWAALLRFLGARAIPGVEEVSGSVYSRTASVAGAAGLLTVRLVPGRNALAASIPLGFVPGLLSVAGRLGRLFDLDADPSAVGADLSRDPLLAPLVARRPGLRIPGAWDPFETAVRAILGQQVSVRGASTLAGRLVERYGRPLGGPATAALGSLFPEPRALAEADLAAIGLPATRAGAMRTLARSVAAGSLDLEGPANAADLERRLLEIKGLGPWTARYIAMRVLGDPDAFPDGDLGIVRALGGLGVHLSPRELARRADAWRPWRAYATMQLWMSKEPT